ncbi:GNAT family N-acetyltransferase [Haloprofundus salilacus]|uniref:GNAT family N-acetyltransferase n=1 Tax=Haloprofundus salilacus TaxID=2876190 RepID=UPI001CC97004|nr:GNAT family protein [Haloprofundus salilacus]
MFPSEIETDHLRLVQLCRDNLSARELYRHVGRNASNVDELSRYTMWDPHRTFKETHDYLVDVEYQWDEREQATYVVYSREADVDDFAGVTNLHLGWKRRSAELGIWLRKPFWGRGYSGERAAALFELAFERLDLELVGAAHQDGNEKSKRAIERYVEEHGGQYDGILRNWIPKGDEVRDLHRYTVSRKQYLESCRST